MKRLKLFSVLEIWQLIINYKFLIEFTCDSNHRQKNYFGNKLNIVFLKIKNSKIMWKAILNFELLIIGRGHF